MEVTASLCVSGMSRVRWISITSGRSFLALLDLSPLRALASRRNLSSGSADASEPSRSISPDASEPLSLPADDRRRRLEGLSSGSRAQSGSGFRRRYCCRSLFMYSVPETTSSASLIRSFRSCVVLARDIANRSSSLSSHAGASFGANSCVGATSAIEEATSCFPSPVPATSKAKRSTSATSSRSESSAPSSPFTAPRPAPSPSVCASSSNRCSRKFAVSPSTKRSSSSSSESLSIICACAGFREGAAASSPLLLS